MQQFKSECILLMVDSCPKGSLKGISAGVSFRTPSDNRFA